VPGSPPQLFVATTRLGKSLLELLQKRAVATKSCGRETGGGAYCLLGLFRLQERRNLLEDRVGLLLRLAAALLARRLGVDQLGNRAHEADLGGD